MQPAHALLAIAGNQRFLDRAGGAAFVRADRLFFQLGFLIPYFMAASCWMTTFIVCSIERTAVETAKTSAEQLIHIAHSE